jgi:serine/threonine protein kinase
MHRIGYTDAVPDAPAWLSPEAKDFLAACFARDAGGRSTAAELLEHPFVALENVGEVKARWVSPKSTLDAAFWEPESEDEEEAEELSWNAAERIKSLACSVSALPDWDSDEGWIDVVGELKDSPTAKEPADVATRAPSKAIGSAAVPAEVVAVVGSLSSDEQLDAEGEPFGCVILADDRSADPENKECWSSDIDVLSFDNLPCNRIKEILEKFRFPRILLSRSAKPSSIPTLFWTRSYQSSAMPTLFWSTAEFRIRVWRKRHVWFTPALRLNRKKVLAVFTYLDAR